jgi:DNA-binding LytR/AlgR family response regulator
MNVLIFEDEKHTAIHLADLLKESDPTIKILDIIGSVKEGIQWFEDNELPDLIFQDIILSDGNCFEIFEAVELTSVPIIFTTAFSEYALRSFQVNSIDYILKPYDIKDVKISLNKLKKFKGIFQLPDKKLLDEILNRKTVTPKQRFLIKIGDNYQTINSLEIAFFESEDGITFATRFNKQKNIVDFSISDLSKQIDANKFFQINRKVIINIESLDKISSWFNSRLKIKIIPPMDNDFIVSRERVKGFKQWLDN